MAAGVDPEMKRRFDAAEKIRIHESDLARPSLSPSAASLRAHFESETGRAMRPLSNPHVEPEVTAEERACAGPRKCGDGANGIEGAVHSMVHGSVVGSQRLCRHDRLGFPGCALRGCPPYIGRVDEVYRLDIKPV